MTYNDTTPGDAQNDFTPSDIANGAEATPTAAPPDAAPLPAPDHPNGTPRHRLCPLDLAELFALDIKPRGMVLEPIIPEEGLVMLYATRGTGKTHVALGVRARPLRGAYRHPRRARKALRGGIPQVAAPARSECCWSTVR
jgi:hypothetical protein